MRKLTQPLTAEEFGALEDKGLRQELVRGEVREMPPPKAVHGVVTGGIQGRLFAFVKDTDLGHVFGETGFILERDPDTVRAPDCAFVRAEHFAAGFPTGYMPFAPDLAVEVLSPDDRASDVEEKTAEWLAAGTRLLWIVDPARMTATVQRPGAPSRAVGADGVLDGEDVLPGFRLELAGIWV